MPRAWERNYGMHTPDIKGGINQLFQNLITIQNQKNERAKLDEQRALEESWRQKQYERQLEADARSVQQAEQQKLEHEAKMQQAKAAAQERKFQLDAMKADIQRQQLKDKAIIDAEVQKDDTEDQSGVLKKKKELPSIGGVEELLRDIEAQNVLDAAREKARAERPQGLLADLIQAPQAEDYMTEGPLGDMVPESFEQQLQRAMQESLASSAGSIEAARTRASGARPPKTPEDIYQEERARQRARAEFDEPDSDKRIWVWNLETGKQEFVPEAQVAAAPPGLYAKKESKGGPVDKNKLEMAITALGGPNSDRKDSLWQLATRINDDPTMAGAVKGPLKGVLSHLTKGRMHPDIRVYEGQIRGFASAIAKAMGESGRLSDQDIERTVMMFPVTGDDPSVTTRKLQAIWDVMASDPAAIVGWIKGEGPMPQGIAEANIAEGGDDGSAPWERNY